MNRFRHFYLYAKGHYKHSDNLIHDLAILCTHNSLINADYWAARPYGIVHFLTKEVFRIMTPNAFDEFICDINPDGIKLSIYDSNRNWSLAKVILTRFMCILSLTTVEDFPEETWIESLGHADPFIMSLSKIEARNHYVRSLMNR
jgi:hypothetical protein